MFVLSSFIHAFFLYCVSSYTFDCLVFVMRFILFSCSCPTVCLAVSFVFAALQTSSRDRPRRAPTSLHISPSAASKLTGAACVVDVAAAAVAGLLLSLLYLRHSRFTALILLRLWWCLWPLFSAVLAYTRAADDRAF